MRKQEIIENDLVNKYYASVRWSASPDVIIALLPKEPRQTRLAKLLNSDAQNRNGQSVLDLIVCYFQDDLTQDLSDQRLSNYFHSIKNMVKPNYSLS